MTKNKNGKIFVSVAGFTDPDIVNTINNMIENCSDPKRLDVHIFYQFDDSLTPFELLKKIDKRGATIKMKAIPAHESQGVCWARHYLISQYTDQDFFLQIDSHHRFEPNFDKICIETIEKLKNIGSEKPVLSCYLPAFNPDNDPSERVKEIWDLHFDRFVVGGGGANGCVFMIPSAMHNFKQRKFPMRGRFVSGHFIFAEGDICNVPFYNPDYFFHSEEILASVQLFRFGWEVWIPEKQIAFHEYLRKGRNKCWDILPDWEERNKKCHSINRQYFHMDPRGDYDFSIYEKNAKFSIQDYEKFAGIHFKSRSVHPDTLTCKEPPILYNYKKYDDFAKACRPVRRHCLDVWHEDMPEYEKIDFVAVIYEHNGRQLFREDFSGVKLEAVFAEKKDKGDSFFKFWSDFISPEKDRYNFPTNAVVWPCLKKEGWGRRLDFNLKN